MWITGIFLCSEIFLAVYESFSLVSVKQYQYHRYVCVRERTVHRCVWAKKKKKISCGRALCMCTTEISVCEINSVSCMRIFFNCKYIMNETISLAPLSEQKFTCVNERIYVSALQTKTTNRFWNRDKHPRPASSLELHPFCDLLLDLHVKVYLMLWPLSLAVN